MAVITRPDESAQATASASTGVAVTMRTSIANALITGSSLSVEELYAARDAYAAAAAAMKPLGPRFANAIRDCVDMHNKAVRRINGWKDQQQRRAETQDRERLMEVDE